MPSPFPGMDPYLEGYLWSDVHHRLATEICRQLTPRLRPRYVARLQIYVVEDPTPEVEIGIMYPDVEVLTGRPETAPVAHPGDETGSTARGAPILAAPLTLPLLEAVEVRLATVQVRDAARNRLVTSIDILSPVNKREPGLSEYRRKRRRLHRAGVHVLELDLLRRGTRPLLHPQLPDVPYLVTLTRAGADLIEAWPIRLQDKLPTVPVPLLEPDPDVPLDLGAALAAIYDEAAYDLSIDYAQPPPPPPLSPEDATWIATLLSPPTGDA